MNTQSEISQEINDLLKEYKIAEKFSHLSYGEISQKLKDAQAELSEFSEACFNQNSIKELQDAIAGEPDSTDMQTWGIDEDEWKEAIETALLALIGEEICGQLDDAESAWWHCE